MKNTKAIIFLYFKNILIGFDQWVNTWFGGSPDTCISTRAYLYYPKLAKVIDYFFGKGHCKYSAKNEEDPGVMDDKQ